MENIERTIEQDKLISRGDIIGVGLSGGKDSMALFHYLLGLQEKYDFELVAIHVDHSIRENSGDDARFVMDYCKSLGVRAYKFKVDANKLAKEKNLSVELAAREARYGVFDACIQKGVVDKIALAHHMSDQAETILMRILRGTGIGGAKGMEESRDGVYIRPMLNTTREAIDAYIDMNGIEFVEDQTNFDNDYARNYIRNEIMPRLKKFWPQAVNSLVSFGKICKEDDEYINSQVYFDALIFDKKEVKIPISYLEMAHSLVVRMVMGAAKRIGITKDFERRHVDLILDLAKHGQNGSKINLPNSVVAHKEYDYITLQNKFVPKPEGMWELKSGEFEVRGFGTVCVKRVKAIDLQENALFIDAKKLPKGAYFRFRKEGDEITKFGGGTKKLKAYFVEKKVPARKRDYTPVLAADNKVYAVCGVGISEDVRVDENSTTIYKIWVK